MTEARKNKKLTQKALAELINLSPMRISHYESDNRQPDIEVIKKISKALEVSPDWLIGIVDKKTAIDDSGLKEIDYKILSLFNSLSADEQAEWIAYADFLRQRRLK